MSKNRPHGNLIPDIHLNSKLFNPKADMKGNQLEENKFLQDLKYQYVQKHDQDRKIYREKRNIKSVDNDLKKSKHRASAGFLMLYKKSLGQLSKEYITKGDSKNTHKVDTEIARTDGLTIDETLHKFAKDNSHIVK